MKNVLFLFLIALNFSCQKGKKNPDACNGDTRREVKLMTDEKSSEVNFVSDTTTIKALGELVVPEVKTDTERQNAEKQLYTVRCKVDKVKREHDGDFHIRLVDGEEYLIAECPNPNCSYAHTSPLLDRYREVYFFVENNHLEGKEVTVTGVAFIDIDHHYKRKQAKNNMELHPVIFISY